MEKITKAFKQGIGTIFGKGPAESGETPEATNFTPASSSDPSALNGLVPAGSREVEYRDQSELNGQLIVAAGQNNIGRIKSLLDAGANIDSRQTIVFDFGSMTFSNKGREEPTTNPTALITALKMGAFDAALFLIQAGADCTLGIPDFFSINNRPIDFVTGDHVPSYPTPLDWSKGLPRIDAKTSGQAYKNYQTDFFTPEQRVTRIKAMIENQKKRGEALIKLVNHHGLSGDGLPPSRDEARSEHTINTAIGYGRAEVFPLLNEIGIEFEKDHFINAADPLHRPGSAPALMDAVLDVLKARDPTIKVKDIVSPHRRPLKDAGREAAFGSNLEAFKHWEALLKREGATPERSGAFADLVADRDPREHGDPVEFINYLADKGYPIDEADEKGSTPADKAFVNRRIQNGLAFLRNGATVKPEHLILAVRFCHDASEGDLLYLASAVAEKGLLTPQVIQNVQAEAEDHIALYEENKDAYTSEDLVALKKTLAPVQTMLDSESRRLLKSQQTPGGALPSSRND